MHARIVWRDQDTTMKQILQDMSKGATYIAEAPAPNVSRETLLIGTVISLISAGTERMLVGFGRASMLDKARQQPEKVKMVLEKIKTDGLLTTVEAVRSKLAQPLIDLGYSGPETDLASLFMPDWRWFINNRTQVVDTMNAILAS